MNGGNKMAMHDEKYKIRDDMKPSDKSHIVEEMEEAMKKKRMEDY